MYISKFRFLVWGAMIFCFSLVIIFSSVLAENKKDKNLSVSEARERLSNMGWSYANEKKFKQAYFKQIKKGDWETVQLFIMSGMTPDTRNRFKETATMVAAGSGQLEILVQFIDISDLTARDRMGWTVSLNAAKGGTSKMIEILNKKKVDFKVKSTNNLDHLMAAAFGGNVSTFQALFKLGLVYDLNAQDNNGKSWLIHAVSNYRKEILKEFAKDKYNNYLLHVNFELTDSRGNTARALAKNLNQPLLVTIIDTLIAKQKELRQAQKNAVVSVN